MSALRESIIIGLAVNCERALQKAMEARALGHRDIEHSWRRIANYNAKLAFKAAQP